VGGVSGKRISPEAIQRDRVASRMRYHKNPELNKKLQAEYRAEHFETRPFVGWDSEGYDAFQVDSKGVVSKLGQRTMIFGCSDGDIISGIELHTKEMLDLILMVEARNPHVFHVWFGGDYDVNQILRDLPWRMLAVLKQTGKVRWNGYRISHVPHKIFTVSKNGIIARLYDCFGFFHCKYETAISKYGVGDEHTLAVISRGKARRGHFTYADLPEVLEYMRAELSLFPPLMDKVRDAAYGGGFRVAAWHGPGALATYALHYNGASKWHSRNVPGYAKAAIRAAYAGGRFQAWQCGYYEGPVYTLDKNSAYVQAIASLPRLDNGKWRRIDASTIQGPEDISRFGLYHVLFDANDKDDQRRRRMGGNPSRPYPLFHRDKNGKLTWPSRVDGWYWSPEAKLVAGDKRARFVEAVVYDDDGTHPFSWVNDSYDARLRLQEMGSSAEKAFKWALAAIYGSFARRVGWDRIKRVAPLSHELAWAGFITSHCRAAIFDVASYAASKGALISVDTDGVMATVPFPPNLTPEGEGNLLGQWKQEKFSAMLYWQNGIYWLRDESGEWKEAKSRGVPKGVIPLSAAMDALSSASFQPPYKAASIHTVRTRYIGYRQALNNQYESWRQWRTEPNDILMGGTGKGAHFAPFCKACQKGSKMSLHTITHIPPKDMTSTEHKLPWLMTQPEDQPIGVISDARLFQMNEDDIFHNSTMEDNL
jgi:hypothetical protein